MDVTTRRQRRSIAAVALCCLAGTLLTPPDGPWNAPGITLAAEQEEAPTDQSESNDPATKAPVEASKDGEDGPADEEPAKSEADESEADESEADESEADESEADESEEIFVPSEDISEDIDVPFPVDI